jgi:hypothetical protein
MFAEWRNPDRERRIKKGSLPGPLGELAEREERNQMDEMLRAELLEMEATQRRYYERMHTIMKTHGWPGRSLIGEDGCKAAWFIVENAVLDPELQCEAFALLLEATTQGEAEGWMVGMLIDHVMRHKNRAERERRTHALRTEAWEKKPDSL